jgi:hypothetical protein
VGLKQGEESMSAIEVINPYAETAMVNARNNNNNGLGTVARAEAEQRALAEVKGRMAIAKHYPRNEFQACQSIIESCKRFKLANECLYSYPRGGQMISGPSIRLAEVMAQRWGNIEFGQHVLSETTEESVVCAYAWDLETNVRKVITFVVQHKILTKSGIKDLSKDPRDLYEHVANLGARRMRACILQIIPRDVQDAAVEQVKATLAQGETGKSRNEQLQEIAAAFSKYGVKVEDLERLFERSLDRFNDDDIVNLRGIYKVIRDDISERERFFPTASSGSTSAAKSKLNKLNLEKPAKAAPVAVEAKPDPETAPPQKEPKKVKATSDDEQPKARKKAKSEKEISQDQRNDLILGLEEVSARTDIGPDVRDSFMKLVNTKSGEELLVLFEELTDASNIGTEEKLSERAELIYAWVDSQDNGEEEGA